MKTSYLKAGSWNFSKMGNFICPGEEKYLMAYFVDVRFFNGRLADFSLPQTVGGVANLVEFMDASKYSLVMQE